MPGPSQIHSRSNSAILTNSDKKLSQKPTKREDYKNINQELFYDQSKNVQNEHDNILQEQLIKGKIKPSLSKTISYIFSMIVQKIGIEENFNYFDKGEEIELYNKKFTYNEICLNGFVDYFFEMREFEGNYGIKEFIDNLDELLFESYSDIGASELKRFLEELEMALEETLGVKTSNEKIENIQYNHKEEKGINNVDLEIFNNSCINNKIENIELKNIDDLKNIDISKNNNWINDDNIENIQNEKKDLLNEYNNLDNLIED